MRAIVGRDGGGSRRCTASDDRHRDGCAADDQHCGPVAAMPRLADGPQRTQG